MRPLPVLLAAVTCAVGIFAGCASGAATTPIPRDPEAVTIDNQSGRALGIAYEAPDGTTEPVVELGVGESVVVRSLFDGREGLCRVGRLVASDPAGKEVAELYNVCRSRLWTVEAP